MRDTVTMIEDSYAATATAAPGDVLMYETAAYEVMPGGSLRRVVVERNAASGATTVHRLSRAAIRRLAHKIRKSQRHLAPTKETSHG